MTNKRDVQRRADEKRAGKRSRGWACIAYPDAMEREWGPEWRTKFMETLNATHLKILVSPLHDKDFDDGADQPKKAHYHILVIFEHPVQEQFAVDRVFSRLKGDDGTYVIARPVQINSIMGNARYLVHLDNPEKAQYDPTDIVALGGADWQVMAHDKADLVNIYLTEIEELIDEQHLVSYRSLCGYARAARPEWVPVIRSHTIHLRAYLQSAAWEQAQGVDFNTGEII